MEKEPTDIKKVLTYNLIRNAACIKYDGLATEGSVYTEREMCLMDVWVCDAVQKKDFIEYHQELNSTSYSDYDNAGILSNIKVGIGAFRFAMLTFIMLMLIVRFFLVMVTNWLA